MGVHKKYCLSQGRHTMGAGHYGSEGAAAASSTEAPITSSNFILKQQLKYCLKYFNYKFVVLNTLFFKIGQNVALGYNKVISFFKANNLQPQSLNFGRII